MSQTTSITVARLEQNTVKTSIKFTYQNIEELKIRKYLRLRYAVKRGICKARYTDRIIRRREKSEPIEKETARECVICSGAVDDQNENLCGDCLDRESESRPP